MILTIFTYSLKDLRYVRAFVCTLHHGIQKLDIPQEFTFSIISAV